MKTNTFKCRQLTFEKRTIIKLAVAQTKFFLGGISQPTNSQSCPTLCPESTCNGTQIPTVEFN